MRLYLKNIAVLLAFFISGIIQAQHPNIYVTSADKGEIKMKIENYGWCKDVVDNMKKKVEKYADRHKTDPEWMVSRLAMYWKDGERYTQCYLKDQNWDRGEGNAPVPTVRMPGMRTWNKYVNVPLEDRIPYNETGDMLGINKLDPAAPPVKVPYKESGHMVRGNNVEILTIGEEAAFLYWLTGEEKYASLSSDIFQTWLLGTYYMNPIKDPEKSCGSFGGWEPGGICGYYDNEQIHDDLAMHAAMIYDFAYDYMVKHPYGHFKKIEKTIPEVTAEVFKRFIDIGLIRGGKSGNWNVNGWNMLLRPVLALDSNDAYTDGKGREYYLNFLVKETTEYHDAIPDMLKSYDSVTGLWPESPGYSFGTIQMLLEWSVLLKRAGYDIIAENPILQKAAMAVFPWMDDSGNLVVFGDSRGGSANYQTFENLLSYYALTGNGEDYDKVAMALKKGIESESYDRASSSWVGLCTYEQEVNAGGEMKCERSSYSHHHRFITMKNWEGGYNMMANIYGGTKGYHLTPNGLALQLYAYGYALAPDAAAYESYWSKDHVYHQSVTGSNTVLPGYTDGCIKVEAMEPIVDSSSFVNTYAMTPYLNFTDVSASEKRRTVVMVKVSDNSGYYMDIFRSDLDDNDYLFHNVGEKMLVTDKKGKSLPMFHTDSIGKIYHVGYQWFDNLKKCSNDGDFRVEWTMPEKIISRLWFIGEKGRTLYTMDAPATTLNAGLTPGNCSMAPEHTPSLLVRQTGNNASKAPFMAVYESYRDNPIVKDVNKLYMDDNCKGMEVRLAYDRTDYLLSSVYDSVYSVKGIRFSGTFGYAAKESGKLKILYLGNGKIIQSGGCKLESADNTPVYMAIYKEFGCWYYSSTGKGIITIDGKSKVVEKSFNCKF